MNARVGQKAFLSPTRAFFLASVFAGVACVSLAARSADRPSIAAGPAAYQQPLKDLSPQALAVFREGAGIFRAAWLPGPSTDTPRFIGLGPLFNRRSCVACHIGNGRGEPPVDASDSMRSILIRLSVPAADKAGTPHPDPLYGDQLQTDAVVGVAPEARASFQWIESTVRLGDGTEISLRRPEILIRDLTRGPLAPNIQMSARISPVVFGLGLLEAVPIETLKEMARVRTSDGVQGRVNLVWDASLKAMAPGRFGLKANQPTLRQQIAAALAGDMGITSYVHPQGDCPPPAVACGMRGSAPEIATADFEALVSYVAALAPPPPRPMDALARAGAERFTAIGCAACHKETLPIGPAAGGPESTSRFIHAYTDLLLHDMGSALADGRPDFQASGRDWRTAPLWGIGLAGMVNDAPTFLHDGRARSLTEAILWHGGEAQAARDRFAGLSRESRDALLAYLGSI